MVGVRDESDQSDSSFNISSASDDSDYEMIPRYAYLLDFTIAADSYRMSEPPISGLGRKIHDFITSSDEESDSEGDDIEYIGTLPGVPGVTYVLLWSLLPMLITGQAPNHHILGTLKLSGVMAKPSILGVSASNLNLAHGRKTLRTQARR